MNQPTFIKTSAGKSPAEKRRLRSDMKRVLTSLSYEDKGWQSAKILERLLESLEWKSAKRVLALASTTNEVDLWPVLKDPPEDKEFFLPKIDPSTNTLKILPFSSPKNLVPNSYGILEPADGFPVDPSTIDLILVPGLAFTPGGQRLGKGGGYYDRLLTQYSGMKIGLCFSEQVLEKIPQDEWDIGMDQVIAS